MRQIFGIIYRRECRKTDTSHTVEIQFFLQHFSFIGQRNDYHLSHTHLLSFLHTVLSRGEVTGILGASITLQFTFNPNISLAQSSHFVIHRYMETSRQKVAEFKQGKGDIFDVNPQNNSVFWHIPILRLNDSGCYQASLIAAPVEKSESVKLTVRELNTNSTGTVLCRVFKKLHK